MSLAMPLGSGDLEIPSHSQFFFRVTPQVEPFHLFWVAERKFFKVFFQINCWLSAVDKGHNCVLHRPLTRCQHLVNECLTPHWRGLGVRLWK